MLFCSTREFFLFLNYLPVFETGWKYIIVKTMVLNWCE